MSKKPVGQQYEIERTNTIARGVTEVILPYGSGYIINGDTYQDEDGEFGVSSGDTGQKYTSATVTSRASSEVSYQDASQSEVTVLSCFEANSATDIDGGLVTYSNSGSAWGLFYWLDTFGGNLRPAIAVSENGGSTTFISYSNKNITLDTRYNACSAWKVSDTCNHVINGEVAGSDVSTAVALNSSSYNTLEVAKRTSGANGLRGSLFFQIIWNRKLSIEEQISITKDPYQFLKPVQTIQDAVYAALFPSYCPQITIVTEVTKGTLNLDTKTGEFTYDYTGNSAPESDFFEYTITDIDGVSNIARVDLNISTAAPRDAVRFSTLIKRNIQQDAFITQQKRDYANIKRTFRKKVEL